MKLNRVVSLMAVACAGLVAPGCGEGALAPSAEVESVSSALTVTSLSLVNGWTRVPGPFPYPQNGPADAGVTLNAGIVQLRGAIAGGTSSTAFTLPSGYRPSATVYLPVSLCNAAKGRLVIAPTGVANVYAEVSFASAQCQTSLEGVSFAASTSGFAALPLQNGWTTTPYGTRAPAAKLMAGNARLVRLVGAIATTGTNASPFTMPLALRPSTDVYVPVDLCNATKGRLLITPAGGVTVVAEGGVFSNAQCFTSLEGVSYSTTPASPSSFTCFGAIPGWTAAPYATRNLCLINDGGVIRLMGALSSAGTNSFVAQLATAWWPGHDVYVEIDLCNGEQGRVRILRDGEMNLEAEHGFAQAACFTSLEGVSYVQ